MQFNPTFISNIRDVYGEAGRLWLQELPSRLKYLSSLWNFRLLSPMASLTYHYVGLVEMNSTKETAVLKMAPVGANIASEVKWLRCMGGAAPKLYAFDKGANAFLMENLKPGHSLINCLQQGNDDAATRIICQTIRHLQSQELTDLSFRHLSELSGDFSVLQGRFDPKLLSKAEGLFKDLTADRSHDILLHGDLHHDNVLLSESGWRVIDPHGYVGNPAAEVGPMVRNFFGYLPKNKPVSKAITRRLHIMAEELPFDPQRIKAWALCMTTLSAAWTFEDHGKVDGFDIEVASAIDQVMF